MMIMNFCLWGHKINLLQMCNTTWFSAFW